MVYLKRKEKEWNKILYMLQKNVVRLDTKLFIDSKKEKKITNNKNSIHMWMNIRCFSGGAPRFFSHASDWNITRIYEGRLTLQKDPTRERLSISGEIIGGAECRKRNGGKKNGRECDNWMVLLLNILLRKVMLHR